MDTVEHAEKWLKSIPGRSRYKLPTWIAVFGDVGGLYVQLHPTRTQEAISATITGPCRETP